MTDPALPGAPAGAGMPVAGPRTPPDGSTLRRRAAWTLADQALSSLTNAGLAVVVARSVTETAFGAFSIALLTFSFVIGIAHATVSEPLVIRFSAAGGAALTTAVRHAAGAALVVGVLAALACAGAGLALPDPDARVALLALAVTLPGLLVQDTWRYGFFAAGRPAAATLNDLVWTVVQFTLVGLLISSGHDSVLLITLAWGGAALVAGLVGCLQMRALPQPTATRSWFRAHRDLSSRLGTDYVLNMGAVNLATYLVGALVGLAGVGGMRAAQVLLGPLQLLFSGLSSFTLPLFSGRVAAGRRLLGPALATAGAAGGVTLVWVTVLLLLPLEAGEQLLGESWRGAREVLPALGLVSGAVAVAMGSAISLKALGRADLLLRVTLVQAPLLVGLGTAGALTDGARGAATGFAAAQVVGAALSWAAFRRAEAAGPPSGTGGGDARRPPGPDQVPVGVGARAPGRSTGHQHADGVLDLDLDVAGEGLGR